ncbi:SGNH/GDSL hydrolase family protein [Candidatus Saccharibacteria bacterium]|nr:SGNH/GDSL hydrolase family protein [Candidatus Saccharibacteria bacterium]
MINTYTSNGLEPVLVPNTDKLVMAGGGGLSGNLDIYELPETMYLDTGYNNYDLRYKLDSLTIGKRLLDSSNNPVATRTIDSSSNGKWLIVQTNSGKLLRINLDNYEVMTFADGLPTNGFYSDYDLAISNDGRYVSSSSYGYLKIYDLSTCGTPNAQDELAVVSGCAIKDLTSFMNSNFTGGFSGAFHASFNSDATVLRFGIDGQNTLTAWGHSNSQLEYLALGDSYSAGEGDTELNPDNGNKYYRPGTDLNLNLNAQPPVALEKCHQSTRSYPYKVAFTLGITQGNFKSVACSGALMKDISGSGGYFGQAAEGYIEGRLKGVYNDLTIAQLQVDALQDFTPGRTRQINFVEKYQPEIITIGIGGNDAGFEAVLSSCWGSHSSPVSSDCWYAGTNNGRMAVAKLIQSSGKKLEALFEKVKRESKLSKVYAIGYPQFVDDELEAEDCPMNVLLSKTERTMIREGVQYLNDYIEFAAYEAGIEYIDIENSLAGYELCGEFYPEKVTGIVARGERGESFHPNAKAHKIIASIISHPDSTSPKTIASNDLNLTSSQTQEPGTPTFFTALGGAYNYLPYYRPEISGDLIVKADDLDFEVVAQGFSPNSSVTVVASSTPTTLDTIGVDANGAISGEVSLPANFEPGFHMLHLYGQSPAGDPIDLFKPITVHASTSDIDGDNISDSQDVCLFATEANIDIDQDGTDDGCDPVIDHEPQLYRVRNGSAELNSKVLYFERNLELASIINMPNDFDSNADGWAVVGESLTTNTEGEMARFWIDSQNIPHASFRNPENGCVQVTPSNLNVVTQAQTRGLTVETTNASTCRASEVDADDDNNGIADNTQTLYRARNGSASVGESNEKIYIERNIVAAEAQLGISDDDENGDGWALLGSSDTTAQEGIFNKLVIINDAPVALYKDASDICKALQPDSLQLVTRAGQKLLNTVGVPTNQNC